MLTIYLEIVQSRKSPLMLSYTHFLQFFIFCIFGNLF